MNPYNLIIDKSRNDIIGLLLSVVVHNQDTEKFLPTLANMGLLEEFDGLLKEISTKEHEREWCSDPDCSYKKP